MIRAPEGDRVGWARNGRRLVRATNNCGRIGTGRVRGADCQADDAGADHSRDHEPTIFVLHKYSPFYIATPRLRRGRLCRRLDNGGVVGRRGYIDGFIVDNFFAGGKTASQHARGKYCGDDLGDLFCFHIDLLFCRKNRMAARAAQLAGIPVHSSAAGTGRIRTNS